MRAFEEMNGFAVEKEAHAELLEREAARRRWANHELELELIFARVEAANIRRESRLFL